MEPDLKHHLQNIEHEVKEVSVKLGGNWYAFFKGLIGGFGSVIGAFLALLIIGWVLNIVGIIPALKDKVDQWQSTLGNAQQSQLPNVKD